MTITSHFDSEKRTRIWRLSDIDQQLRQKMFEMLSRNFREKEILKWEDLGIFGKDCPECMWDIYELQWLLYLFNGLKCGFSVCEDFDGILGHYIIIEANIPITASVVTWARTLRKK